MKLEKEALNYGFTYCYWKGEGDDGRDEVEKLLRIMNIFLSCIA
jgi:hypothetical protein